MSLVNALSGGVKAPQDASLSAPLSAPSAPQGAGGLSLLDLIQGQPGAQPQQLLAFADKTYPTKQAVDNGPAIDPEKARQMQAGGTASGNQGLDTYIANIKAGLAPQPATTPQPVNK